MTSELERNLILECHLSPSQLNPNANKTNWGSGGKRGGFVYNPPSGWKGIGLNVSGKYDDGNNDWLANNGNKNEWALAYHSINAKIIKNFLGMGFRMGPGQNCKDYDDIYHPGQKVGVGVYFTPDPKKMEEFAKNNVSVINGKKYSIALMVRVKPDKIRCPSGYQSFWVVNASPDEVRPYRILLKEI